MMLEPPCYGERSTPRGMFSRVLTFQCLLRRWLEFSWERLEPGNLSMRMVLERMETSSHPMKSAENNPHPIALTTRQAEVARLIADDLSNAEMAVELGLSVRTVEKHVENIFRRLGVASRADAIAIWRSVDSQNVESKLRVEGDRQEHEK